MWKVLAAAFVAASFGTASALILGPGCSFSCNRTFDCGDESYCGFDHRCHTDCFSDVDCRNSGLGFRCAVSTGRCLDPIGHLDPGTSVPPVGPVDETWDGFNAEPNTGKTFIISALGISSDRDIGQDVNGQCESDSSCVENVLSAAAGYANTLIENGVAYGDSLIIVEIAGLEPTPTELDKVTIKLYGAVDADEPPRFNNNFRTPNGENGCCTFKIDSQSILNNQATARIRARIYNGQILPIERNDASFTLALGRAPHPVIHLKSASISGRYSDGGIRGGLLGGAIPMTDLASSAADPFCLPSEPNCNTSSLADRTVLDLVSALIAQPDIDLDGDGLECTYRTSGNPTIDGCCDGNLAGPCLGTNGTCIGTTIPPLVADRPASCAESSAIKDGYSVGLAFDAVPAIVNGIR